GLIHRGDAARRGWASVMHFRGCSGEPNRQSPHLSLRRNGRSDPPRRCSAAWLGVGDAFPRLQRRT
ncbi:hypothetical protein C3E93_28565, partial [Klebsiella pneumoniae]